MTSDIRTRSRAMPLALTAIVIGGAVLRLWGLGSSPLNFDESFTAMAGRLPLGGMFDFLRAHDSHPPLDYLLQLPLARAGASPFVFRLPAVACSIGALALFAWWMRGRALVGIVATAAMAVCAFQIAHGREARMYAVMELIGVAIAVTAESWLRAPRRRHAAVIGALVFAGLMTHVSMFLAAVGLLAVAGRRNDRDAWRWRAGIGAGIGAWALAWGPSFLVQARGGHSSWIPHTTVTRFIDTISNLVTFQSGVGLLVCAAIGAGIVICRRRDATLATVVTCCFVVPVVLAGIVGLRAPVLLDRTLTVVAWAPLLALGYAVDALARRASLVGAVAAALVLAVMVPTAVHTITTPSAPTVELTELERLARPGDVIAVQPASKGIELYWTLGIRSDDGATRAVQIVGLKQSIALELDSRPATGRIWLIQYVARPIGLAHFRTCAPTWHHGATRLLCIDRSSVSIIQGAAPSIPMIYVPGPTTSTTRPK